MKAFVYVRADLGLPHFRLFRAPFFSAHRSTDIQYFYFRPSASVLLTHPFFRHLRKKTTEELPSLLHPVTPLSDVSKLPKGNQNISSFLFCPNVLDMLGRSPCVWKYKRHITSICSALHAHVQFFQFDRLNTKADFQRHCKHEHKLPSWTQLFKNLWHSKLRFS